MAHYTRRFLQRGSSMVITPSGLQYDNFCARSSQQQVRTPHKPKQSRLPYRSLVRRKMLNSGVRRTICFNRLPKLIGKLQNANPKSASFEKSSRSWRKRQANHWKPLVWSDRSRNNRYQLSINLLGKRFMRKIG